MKRLVSLILALVFVLCAFSGCADKKEAAMSLENGGSVSINFMYLLASIQKSMYKSVADAAGGSWDTVIDASTGETLTDLLYEVTLTSAESSLICEYMHDTVYALSLTEAQKKSVDKQIDSLTTKAGSKRNLEEQLSLYSADIATMRRYLELSLKQGNLYNHFYGENGVHATPESDIRTFFEKNYHIVTHIYFSDTKVKEDGTVISLTDEELAQKHTLAETVYNRILAGEDFYTLKDEYSEDAYESEYYPYGFFVTADAAFPAEFTNAAIEMRVGEYRLTESRDHILYKLPMDADLYKADQTVYLTIKNLLDAADFDKRVAEYKQHITVDEGQLALFNIAVVPEYAY